MVMSLSSEGATWARLTPKKDMHGRETTAHLVYACFVVRGRPSQILGLGGPLLDRKSPGEVTIASGSPHEGLA
jgi:hypothetical protein